MANNNNLVKNSDRTPEERRENARKAGVASGEARRLKRDLKRAFDYLLEADHKVKDKNTGEIKELGGADALAWSMFQRALKGNTRAFEMVRDTAGQKPVDKIIVTEIDTETVNEIEEMIADYEQESSGTITE